MITDEERREIAAKLRELGVCELDGEFIDCGEVEDALGLVSDDGAWYEAQWVLHLADLIEPSYDRDALLTLAGEMYRDGKMQRERQKAGGHWFVDGLDVMEYARRIREALGVE